MASLRKKVMFYIIPNIIMKDKSDEQIQSIFIYLFYLFLHFVDSEQKKILTLGLNVCQGANYLAETSSLDLDATVHSQKEAARGSMRVTGRKRSCTLRLKNDSAP